MSDADFLIDRLNRNRRQTRGTRRRAAPDEIVARVRRVDRRSVRDNARHIVEYATRQRLPLVGGWGAWVEAGALISYGPNIADMTRQATTYLDKVLKGAKPGDLPVQQPTRFELFVNLKTAKSLGLNIPESFLLRADRVIE